MHKPNPKHTLDEVLKSLQDLIRNELLDDASSVRKPTAADERSDSQAAVTTTADLGREPLASSDAPAPAAERLDLPQVIESLHALVTDELAVGTEQGVGDGAARDLGTEDPGASALAPETPGAAAQTEEALASLDGSPHPVPPEGLQEELPLFAPPTAGDEIAAYDVPPAPAPAPDASPPEAHGAEPPAAAADDGASADSIELADPFSLPPARSAPSSDPAPAPAPEEIELQALHADDIPVLEDIALPPPGETPAPPPSARRPDPSQAHALAVRVVARLNIELRKSGERPLDARIIKRLELLLREALEQPMQSAE